MFRSFMTVALLGLATVGAQAAPPKPLIATDVQCSGCVNQQDIAANAVGAAQIQANAVGPTEIVDGSVSDAKLTQAVRDRIAALESQVTALQAQPTALQVKANGVSIGAFVQTVYPFSITVQRAFSSTGYLFDVITTGNDFSGDHEHIGELMTLTINFESNNCTGTAYVLTTGATFDERGVAPGQGFVFRVGENNSVSRGNFYNPAGSQVFMHTYGSSTGGTDCHVGLTTGTGVIALPNDPAITGVPNQPFAAPITIGR